MGKTRDLGFTAIRVSDETHDELSAIGSHNESFDDIVQKLLKHWRETKISE